MIEQEPGKRSRQEATFTDTVGAQERRKLRSLQGRPQVWSGLGMLGLVGWSIGVPTLAGAFLGLWLDERHPGTHSWTLSLMIAGLCVGCANTWRWIAREQQEIHRENDGKGNDS